MPFLRPFPTRRARGALLLAATLLLAAGGPARAQALQVLHGVARGYDAGYLSAQLQADAAEQKAVQARALKKPSVSLVGSVTAAQSETPWSSTTRSRSLQQQVGVSAQYTLYNKVNDGTLSQAEAGVELAQAQLRAAEQDLAMRVAQAYFDVLAAGDALATVQASRKAIAEQLAAARHQFKVGGATITDAREAEARHDLARAQELAAENELQAARLALDHLVGRSGMAPKPLAQPLKLPELEPADPEAWARLADEHSPALRQLRVARLIGETEADKARAAALPTVTLNGALTVTHAAVDGHSKAATGGSVAVPTQSGVGPSASVGVQLAMPLYSGGAVQGRQRETVLLAQKSEADLEAARRSVAQAVRTAFFGLQSLRARVLALEAAEASSRLALEAIEFGYQVGMRPNLDVLNAQTQLHQARRDLARARYELLLGGLRLKQTAGVLKTDDIRAVSALSAP